MELTRFDLQNQAIQVRIAAALERIAAALERGHEFPAGARPATPEETLEKVQISRAELLREK